MAQQNKWFAGTTTALCAAAFAVLALGASQCANAQTSQAAYDELIAKAKQEGEVVVVGSTGRTRRESRTAAFQQKYGIKVTYLAGNANDMMAKIITEYRAQIHRVDVWSGGARERTQELYDGGIIQPLTPLLVHPEVTDPSLFYRGRYWWTVKDLGMLTAAFPVPIFTYNTKTAKPDEITSWRDLLQPKFTGRIAIVEPDPGTASGMMVFLWRNPKLGSDWFTRLVKDQKPGLFSDGALATERLARGVYDIGLYNISDAVAAEKQGLPVGIRVKPLLEGADLTAGGSNHLMAFAKPAHPNAQKLWINWFLSREGQINFQRVEGLYQSVRDDIPTDMLPQDFIRQPGIPYDFVMADPETPKLTAEFSKFWSSLRR
jgi:iron(III) transport system substrate-binding protein